MGLPIKNYSDLLKKTAISLFTDLENTNYEKVGVEYLRFSQNMTFPPKNNTKRFMSCNEV